MIELSGVSFRYRRDSEQVIEDLSHHFDSGTMTAISGPSGRGKSTVLYLIGLMLTPSSGTISLDGTPTAGLCDADRSRLRAERVGFVFQDAMLDPSRTVLDNVVEGSLFVEGRSTAALARARTLLSDLGVADRIDHRPGEISGGQAQRVALCRALVKEPSIILADEPTGNLDPVSAEIVWDCLRDRASAGTTVIVATHDPERVMSAEHRVML